MSRGNVYISSYPDNPPEGYWVSGLHDACITCVETFEFPFDYNKMFGSQEGFDYKKYISEIKAHNKNLMTLEINAKNALYDQSVKEIRLYNYKIITKDIELRGRNQVWWMADKLTEKDGHYTMSIELVDCDSSPCEFTYVIQFDRLQVVR